MTKSFLTSSAKKQEQDRVVKYIKNHVELTNGDQINKVEFIDFQNNEMIGTWVISTEINGTYSIGFSEDKFSGELISLGYKTSELEVSTKTKNKSESIDDIKVIYSKLNLLY
ncbi:hypothetical protein [Streptococcus parauberis]|uniref:hypothetical protein n=1 Tax=Streptococcus parauberis TaxID=1348 RepID=UPI0037B75DB5